MECQRCKALYDTPLAGGCPRCGFVPGGSEEIPGGFWLRFAASIVDGIVVTFAAMVVGIAFSLSVHFLVPPLERYLPFGVSQLVGMAVSAAYYTFLTAREGQTLGKMLLSLKVVSLDGSPIGLGTSFGRWAAYLLSYLPLGLGFLWVGFSESKRGFHDMAAGTRVVCMPTERSRTVVIAVAVIACAAVFMVLTVGILAAIAIPKFADLQRRAEEGSSKGSLGMVRSALSIYYGDMEGQYPTDVQSLVPKYLQAIPAAKVPPHHAPSDEVHIISPLRPDGDRDTGGWRYDNDPASKDWGTFTVNCTHTDARGRAWDAY